MWKNLFSVHKHDNSLAAVQQHIQFGGFIYVQIYAAGEDRLIEGNDGRAIAAVCVRVICTRKNGQEIPLLYK